VLDPACGSGNFLYVSLRQLLDLEKAVITFASGVCGLTGFFPRVAPEQMRGLEVNDYAHELASVTVWIGYIQWMRENGFGDPGDPVLRRLDDIRHQDAVLAMGEDGMPTEPPWPDADVIVGNPPFLGDKKMRAELGDDYVDALRGLYAGRVRGGADLVCYWFERARALIEAGEVQRAGLLCTNSIRFGENRKVLDRIKETGDLFMARGDRPWVLDGAAVRVSMIGFDDGSDTERTLEGVSVSAISPDLTARGVDVTTAAILPENAGIVFLGMMKAGPFDLDGETARAMLSAPVNVNGHPNADVVKRRLGGQDVTGR
jgi:type II restriction/modification system DNA methylase subunit YeeA